MGLAVAALVTAGCSTPKTTLTVGDINLRTSKAVLEADRAAGGDCPTRRIASTEIVQAPTVVVTPVRPDTIGMSSTPESMHSIGFGGMAGGGPDSKHVERWTVDRCGTSAKYLVTFGSDGRGGTSISVKPE